MPGGAGMPNTKERREFISVIKKSEAAKVYLNDIVYIENEARRIHIHTENDTYSVYRRIDEVASLLPENFYRCHKSCIINLDKVNNMKNRIIYFEGGKTVGICAEKYAKAVQTYKGYLIRYEKSRNEHKNACENKKICCNFKGFVI